MKVMIFVKASPESEAGAMPSADNIAEMMKFNEELAKAGVLLDLNGLQPTSRGARVRYDGAKRTVVDGPFAEAKELVAGYWVLQVKSMQEALEWAKRVPFQDGETEVRPIFEMTDFPEVHPETLQTAAAIDQKINRG